MTTRMKLIALCLGFIVLLSAQRLYLDSTLRATIAETAKAVPPAKLVMPDEVIDGSATPTILSKEQDDVGLIVSTKDYILMLDYQREGKCRVLRLDYLMTAVFYMPCSGPDFYASGWTQTRVSRCVHALMQQGPYANRDNGASGQQSDDPNIKEHIQAACDGK